MQRRCTCGGGKLLGGGLARGWSAAMVMPRAAKTACMSARVSLGELRPTSLAPKGPITRLNRASSPPLASRNLRSRRHIYSAHFCLLDTSLQRA